MKKLVIFFLIFTMTIPCFAAPTDKMSAYLLAAKEEGIIFGDEKGNLQEDKVAVRAEFLALLVRFLELSGGENVFTDVSDTDWFAGSIASANFCGIFAGYDDGTARPYESIKTEDAIAILGRYYNVSEHKGKYSGVSPYAEDYFGYAFEKGIFSAWQHLPSPKQGITKGEIVSILYRYREENAENICFSKNYPKISNTQIFNTLSVDVKLVEDCELYYALCEKGNKNYNWVKVSDKEQAKKEKTISITGDINKVYDLYIKAISVSSGRARIKELKNVAPLAFIRGAGTEQMPYVIYTEHQLTQISNFPDKSYILGGDIKISGKWEPITNFSGSLNGDGYRITGISIQGNDKIGFFADINGGTVKNLTVDANVKAKSAAGIIAGKNSGTIESCCAVGTVEASSNYAGGIVGQNSGEINDCLSCVYSVRAGSFAGGIAGQNGGTVRNCLSAVETVTSDMYAGGIAGQNNGGKIENCVAANIAVYNTMTYNGGKIGTNKNEGIMKNNFSLDSMVSNAAQTEESADSRNGLETPWNALKTLEFYVGIGWSSKTWREASGGFEFIYPQGAAEPMLESGLTPYLPKKIHSQDELVAIRKNGKGHYVLANDITLKVPWKMIDIKDGFTGTLDGNGHTIYNLTLKGENGMFSNIAGGTVKNLKIAEVTAYYGFDGGIIAACNYGYIENCSVSGEMSVQRAKRAGGIAGENNGRISGCRVNAKIAGNAAEIGGICAVNNAVVEKSSFSGSMEITGDGIYAGGICAKDNEGYISESASNAAISAQGNDFCIGGICAQSELSQIYKCASLGSCKQSGGDAKIGGICALTDGATVYNCFSLQSINSDAENAISGGICAESKDSNIQNTYSAGRLTLSGDASVSGGICALAEGSYIMQNAVLNPAISAKKSAGGIVAEGSDSDLSDNYICSRVSINLKSAESQEKNGIAKAFKDMLNTDFYLTPISQEGLMGWDDTAWEASVTEYLLPILTDTPLMKNLKNPTYK